MPQAHLQPPEHDGIDVAPPEPVAAASFSPEREHDELERGVDRRFHRYWGSLFKAGGEVSSFGDQVETYACLYTSRVSNLLRYSPMHFFTSPRDRMPHELP